MTVQARDSLWQDRIVGDVGSQLAAKGWTVFDIQGRNLLWRASSNDRLSGDSEKNEKKLEKNVTDMFKHFPPKPRG